MTNEKRQNEILRNAASTLRYCGIQCRAKYATGSLVVKSRLTDEEKQELNKCSLIPAGVTLLFSE